MNKKFNRSKFMKSRWDVAKKKAIIYEKIGGSKVDKKSFLSSNKNPLDSSIVTYEISTQLNYQSDAGGLIIKPKTFQVTAFRTGDVDNSIEKKTKQSFASMKINGDTFNPQLQSQIEKKLSVDFREIRGFEETKKDLSPAEYSKLLSGEFIVTSIDNNVKFTKGKGGKNYDAKQDLSGFM